jgi:radical SAM superfamily enzyme YgiQ (UPF0313 family)
MNILLVQPSRLNSDGSVYRNKFRWLLGMSLPYIAGLTPSEHCVKIVDDCLDKIPYDLHWDVVGITFMSHQAPRAYEIAREFRERKVPVIMGGFHVSLGAKEVLDHADAVVVGEAEYSWPKALNDLGAGHLQRVYKADEFSDLKGLPSPRYDLVDLKRYKIPNIPIQTTRGCPWACNYCEVTQVYGGKYRFRPVDEVIQEIKDMVCKTGRRFLYFVDDNFGASRNRAMALMEKLIPMGIKWTGLCTMSIGDDPKFLDMMRRSGCVHINMGMESISPDSLKNINKSQNMAGEYEKQIAVVRKAGIDFSINVMFGLDGDTIKVFDLTREFLIKNKVPSSYMFILAPRIGTKIREQMVRENRILTDDWTRYCGYEPVHQPKRMSLSELHDGFWRVQKQFYSISSIVRRLLLPPQPYTFQSLPMNLAFYWSIKRGIHPMSYF